MVDLYTTTCGTPSHFFTHSRRVKLPWLPSSLPRITYWAVRASFQPLPLIVPVASSVQVRSMAESEYGALSNTVPTICTGVPWPLAPPSASSKNALAAASACASGIPKTVSRCGRFGSEPAATSLGSGSGSGSGSTSAAAAVSMMSSAVSVSAGVAGASAGTVDGPATTHKFGAFTHAIPSSFTTCHTSCTDAGPSAALRTRAQPSLRPASMSSSSLTNQRPTAALGDSLGCPRRVCTA